jgi:hypothetical protein
MNAKKYAPSPKFVKALAPKVMEVTWDIKNRSIDMNLGPKVDRGRPVYQTGLNKYSREKSK